MLACFLSQLAGRRASLLTLFALVALLLAAPGARAQDVIIDLNGNELPGQVVEITPTQVLYRTPETDPALPPSVLDKRTLFMIRFANGTKEVFGATPATPTAPDGLPAASPASTASPASVGAPTDASGLTLIQQLEMRERGRQDAFRYYNRTGPFLGSMAGTLVAGALPGIIIACIKPKAYKNKRLDPKLLPYPSYVEGYEHAARKRKTWPVVGGFLTGLVLFTFLSAAGNP